MPSSHGTPRSQQLMHVPLRYSASSAPLKPTGVVLSLLCSLLYFVDVVWPCLAEVTSAALKEALVASTLCCSWRLKGVCCISNVFVFVFAVLYDALLGECRFAVLARILGCSGSDRHDSKARKEHALDIYIWEGDNKATAS